MKALNILIILILIVPATAQVGSTGINILNFTPNPRSVALGEASTALFDDVSTVYWNPAGMATLSSPQLAASYRRIIDNTYFINVQAVFPFFRGGVGLDFSYLFFGETPVYEGGEQRQTATPYELSLGFSGSFSIVRWLQVGVSGKWIREQLLDSIQGDGFSFDLGVFFHRPFLKSAFLKHLSMSVVVAHLGLGPQYFEQPTALPTTLRWGFIYSLPFAFNKKKELEDKQNEDKLSKLNFIFDVNFIFQESVRVGGGIEWILPKFAAWSISLRLGYKQVIESAFFYGFTGGAGVSWRSIEINYGLSSQGEFGFDHFIGVGYKLPPFLKNKPKVDNSEI